VPLEFNVYQREMVRKIKEAKDNGQMVRFIVLKARQTGISTFCTAYTFHSAATNFYVRAVTVANDIENTNNLFNMQKVYYAHCDPKIRPMQTASNKKEIVFDNPDKDARKDKPGLMSSLHLETAGKATAGRSGTIHHLHCSEFAFWPDAATTMTAILQSVPRTPSTSVFIESTANGVGGLGKEFKDRWDAASKGESEYIPVFFPWFWSDDYKIVGAKIAELDDYEKYLVDKFGVTEEKLAWRRWKIKNEMGSALLDPIEQYNQEYPATPDEAFISSGRPVFNIRSLADKIDMAKAAKFERFEI